MIYSRKITFKKLINTLLGDSIGKSTQDMYKDDIYRTIGSAVVSFDDMQQHQIYFSDGRKMGRADGKPLILETPP